MLKNYIVKNWKNCIKNSDTKSGLRLPYSVSVPCIGERFTCFFYWDTYFTNLGLLSDAVEQARNNIENMKFFVEEMGYIPNGNEKVMFNRSQPPLYAHAVKDYFLFTGDVGVIASHYESMKREYGFWQKSRMTEIGLNQYGANPTDQEIDDFYDELHGRGIEVTREKETLLPYFAEAESGWDFSPRYNGQALRFVQVDLNAILYQTECFLRDCARLLEYDTDATDFAVAAERRKDLMNEYLCDENGVYHDYDFLSGKRSSLVTAASLTPFAMGVSKDAIAAQKTLEKLEFAYGVAAGERETGGRGFQWAFPNSWPPLVYWSYQAMQAVGDRESAKRIQEKYMQVLERNFEKTGVLWEKYSVETGEVSHMEYESPPMMGWTAGVYRYFQEEKNKNEEGER